MNLILMILLDIIPLINAALTELPETCNGPHVPGSISNGVHFSPCVK